MGDRILNPRRVPRAPVRCEARCLLPGGGFWASDTTDVGASGCQVVAPERHAVGDPLQLTLSNERLERPLAATAQVAWASRAAPWRVGITFDAASRVAAAAWFEALLAAYPGLATFQHAPEALEVDAVLHLGREPRVAPELNHEEVAVLRLVGAGATVRALRQQLQPDWPGVEGTLFGLVGRQILTLDAARAGRPEAWASYLSSAP